MQRPPQVIACPVLASDATEVRGLKVVDMGIAKPERNPPSIRCEVVGEKRGIRMLWIKKSYRYDIRTRQKQAPKFHQLRRRGRVFCDAVITECDCVCVCVWGPPWTWIQKVGLLANSSVWDITIHLAPSSCLSSPSLASSSKEIHNSLSRTTASSMVMLPAILLSIICIDEPFVLLQNATALAARPSIIETL
jgi:hypothetical protein